MSQSNPTRNKSFVNVESKTTRNATVLTSSIKEEHLKKNEIKEVDCISTIGVTFTSQPLHMYHEDGSEVFVWTDRSTELKANKYNNSRESLFTLFPDMHMRLIHIGAGRSKSAPSKLLELSDETLDLLSCKEGMQVKVLMEEFVQLHANEKGRINSKQATLWFNLKYWSLVPSHSKETSQVMFSSQQRTKTIKILDWNRGHFVETDTSQFVGKVLYNLTPSLYICCEEKDYCANSLCTFEDIRTKFSTKIQKEYDQVVQICTTTLSKGWSMGDRMTTIQKIIRYGAGFFSIGAHQVSADAFLIYEVLQLMHTPTKYDPNLKRMRRGLEYACRRLAIVMVEDSYVEQKNWPCITQLLATAYLATQSQNYFPSSSMVVSWLLCAINCISETRTFQYTVTRNIQVRSNLHSTPSTWNTLFSNMGGMEFDKNMLQTIARNEGECVKFSSSYKYSSLKNSPLILPRKEVIPLERVLDQHSRPEAIYLLDYEYINMYRSTHLDRPFEACFEAWFRLVTGQNPRRPKSTPTTLEQKFISGVYKAQKRMIEHLYLETSRNPIIAAVDTNIDTKYKRQISSSNSSIEFHDLNSSSTYSNNSQSPNLIISPSSSSLSSSSLYSSSLSSSSLSSSLQPTISNFSSLASNSSSISFFSFVSSSSSSSESFLVSFDISDEWCSAAIGQLVIPLKNKRSALVVFSADSLWDAPLIVLRFQSRRAIKEEKSKQRSESKQDEHETLSNEDRVQALNGALQIVSRSHGVPWSNKLSPIPLSQWNSDVIRIRYRPKKNVLDIPGNALHGEWELSLDGGKTFGLWSQRSHIQCLVPSPIILPQTVSIEARARLSRHLPRLGRTIVFPTVSRIGGAPQCSKDQVAFPEDVGVYQLMRCLPSWLIKESKPGVLHCDYPVLAQCVLRKWLSEQTEIQKSTAEEHSISRHLVLKSDKQRKFQKQIKDDEREEEEDKDDGNNNNNDDEEEEEEEDNDNDDDEEEVEEEEEEDNDNDDKEDNDKEDNDKEDNDKEDNDKEDNDKEDNDKEDNDKEDNNKDDKEDNDKEDNDDDDNDEEDNDNDDDDDNDDDNDDDKEDNDNDDNDEDNGKQRMEYKEKPVKKTQTWPVMKRQGQNDNCFQDQMSTQMILSGRRFHGIWATVGAGKTGLVVCFMRKQKEKGLLPRHVVWTTPKEGIQSLQSELALYGISSNVLGGKTALKITRTQNNKLELSAYTVSIIEHDHVRTLLADLWPWMRNALFVVDEIHKLHDPKTQRASAIMQLLYDANQSIWLTGTAVTSDDLSLLCRILQPMVSFPVNLETVLVACSRLIMATEQLNIPAEWVTKTISLNAREMSILRANTTEAIGGKLKQATDEHTQILLTMLRTARDRTIVDITLELLEGKHPVPKGCKDRPKRSGILIMTDSNIHAQSLLEQFRTRTGWTEKQIKRVASPDFNDPYIISSPNLLPSNRTTVEPFLKVLLVPIHQSGSFNAQRFDTIIEYPKGGNESYILQFRGRIRRQDQDHCVLYETVEYPVGIDVKKLERMERTIQVSASLSQGLQQHMQIF